MLLIIGFVFTRAGLQVMNPEWQMEPSFRHIVDNSILPPINEEIVFRGLFLTILLDAMPGKKIVPIMLSAGLFIGMHFSLNPERVISLAVLGILLGAIFVQSRSVLLCLLCHGFWNSVDYVRWGTIPGYQANISLGLLIFVYLQVQFLCVRKEIE